MKQPVPKFTGHIEAGRLNLIGYHRIALDRYLQTFKNKTKVDVVIRKHRSQRTNDQNNYYWGVVVKILGDHFGYDPEDMHTELKRLFNHVKSKIDGQVIGGTTTKMNTVEFFQDEDSYIERICRWAAVEHQVYIPPPQKVEVRHD